VTGKRKFEKEGETAISRSNDSTCTNKEGVHGDTTACPEIQESSDVLYTGTLPLS
jgi:hypothetical protein